jgi:5-methylcytosine-specific restriction enzyme subunit McrC
VIQRGARTIALLDAKYRDLWEHSLPREMLYQLAIYALSQAAGAEAVIVYPTLHPGVEEARIAIRDPLYSDDRAYVVLRPVNLLHLERLISASDGRQERQACANFARYLVLG